VIAALDPAKDVDGLHPFNAGNLVLGNNSLRPCTPSGIIEILRRENISTKGAHAVVIGRSNLVGRPLALLLSQKSSGANATVTICHTGTQDLSHHTKQADILVVAAGRPNFIVGDMLKPGTVVIDVGINRVDDPVSRRGYRLTGDVDFEAIIRALNQIDYRGPLSVEWEDSGMDREHGARESCQYVKEIDFVPSTVAFDAAFEE